jgi:lysophospholipase L1-like esterase
MKTLLCYGDSNTHGSLPLPGATIRPPSTNASIRNRLGPFERWPGIVRQRLGSDWLVVEAGLGGRTTVLDDPIDGVHKNGMRGLPIALETHRPIDLVVLMLGTNDLKTRFAMTAIDIARANGALVKRILGSVANGPDGKRGPNILLVAPPHVLEVGDQAEVRTGGATKSQRFGTLFARLREATASPSSMPPASLSRAGSMAFISRRQSTSSSATPSPTRS